MNDKMYITLGMLLKFGSLDKVKITYLDPKYYLGRSGMGLITSLGLKTNASSRKKKGKVCHYYCQYELLFKYYQENLKFAL